MSLKTIIVEDEHLCRMFLDSLIKEFCPEIEIVAFAATEDEAVAAITEHQPDLVFADIELQQGNGFNMLKRVPLEKLHVVFTTADDHYAINAIMLSGSHYLLKPFDYEDLLQVVKTVQEQHRKNIVHDSLQHLLNSLQNEYVPVNIAIHTDAGMEFIEVKNIVRIESAEDNVHFILKTGTKKNVLKNIKQWELLLSPHSFFRIHQSHIINLDEIKTVNAADNPFLVMTDDSEVMISVKKLEELKSR